MGDSYLGLDYYRSFEAFGQFVESAQIDVWSGAHGDVESITNGAPRARHFLGGAPPRALLLAAGAKAIREEKLASYGGFERESEALYREGGLSRKAYLETLLTPRRGLGVEKSYVGWCEEAARITSGS